MIDIPWAHLGYYQVGNEIHRSRIPAIVSSINSSEHHHVRWIFNDNIFSRYDWKQAPEKTLDELYRDRAQQLRDSYDYLVLSWSGGSDSDNVLNTFLSNNIFLDEIYVRSPRELVKNLYTPNCEDTSIENSPSEYDFVIKPRLAWLARTHPEIKITLDDPSDVILNYTKTTKENDWMLNRTTLTPGGEEKFKNIRNSYKPGKKTAHIYGLDKPRIMFKDGKYHAYFLDWLVSIYTIISDWNIDSCIVPEPFYWSPDCVPLIIAQCHTVKNFFQKNHTYRFLLDGHALKSSENINLYHDLLRPLLYPSTWTPRFQVKKATNPELHDRLWLSVVPDRFVSNYYSGLKEFFGLIETRYLDQTTKNVVGFTNGFYEL